MNKRQLLVPLFFRFFFFMINFYLTTQLVSYGGWGLFPILFAIFATRDFVQASQLVKIYFQFKNINKK